jgi:hypothetical protein
MMPDAGQMSLAAVSVLAIAQVAIASLKWRRERNGRGSFSKDACDARHAGVDRELTSLMRKQDSERRHREALEERLRKNREKEIAAMAQLSSDVRHLANTIEDSGG